MTPTRLMRTLTPAVRSTTTTTTTPKHVVRINSSVVPIAVTNQASRVNTCSKPKPRLPTCRCFAQVNDTEHWNRDFWFSASPTSSSPLGATQSHHKPPDERTIQLGKTVRTLHDRLPSLLKEPLPAEILSPNVSLHLFPSTHPHLPTVSGRLAYIAALWTAPVAWGRMPLIGNVKLIILSERMVRNGGSAVPLTKRDEKLVVKWKTCGKTTHRDGTGGIYRGMGLAAAKDPVDKIAGFIAGTADGEKAQADPEEFCGIFIFEFDDKAKIWKHTIEHTEEGGHGDKMTRVVSVTDWLLGQFHGRKREDVPALAWCEERPHAGLTRLVDRRLRV